MKFFVYLALASLLSALSFNASSVEEYRLSSGDLISISVFSEPDLSIDMVRLNEQGGFSYPFIGEINAEGLSALELQDKITKKLTGDYLVNPKVNVRVIEYRQFFVIGEVKHPDGYSYQPGLTVRRAIALAGGLTERASKSKMSIVRDVGSQQVSTKVNMKDLIKPGDTLSIEQGFF